MKDIGRIADGVVIGSEIVKRFAESDPSEMFQFLRSIRKTLDQI